MKTITALLAFGALFPAGAAVAGEHLDYYETDDGNSFVNCNGNDPNGNWVPCPTESDDSDWSLQGLREKFNDATDKVYEAFQYPEFGLPDGSR